MINVALLDKLIEKELLRESFLKHFIAKVKDAL